MPSVFDRAISPRFLAVLRQEAQRDGWWSDVLRDRSLVIALRGSYLNVYWRGNSLFRVQERESGLHVTTHQKFLIDPALSGQVSLTGGIFESGSLSEKAFIRHYEGPATIEAMKRAAGLFSHEEKSGCHRIAVNNPSVIDVEIAFPGRITLETGAEVTSPRVDLAAIVLEGDRAALKFWEAKAYGNGDLRAVDAAAIPVCAQVRGYQRYLTENREAVELSYARVAANLVALKDMGWTRDLAPAIREVGGGRLPLVLDPGNVGLIVFGFDSAQRDSRIWSEHLARLRGAIDDVRLAGDAKNIRL